MGQDINVGEPIRGGGGADTRVVDTGADTRIPAAPAQKQEGTPEAGAGKGDAAVQAQIKDLQDRLTRQAEELFEARQAAKAASIPKDVLADPVRLLEYAKHDPYSVVAGLFDEDTAKDLKNKREAPPPDPEKEELKKRLEVVEAEAQRARVLEAKDHLRKFAQQSTTEALAHLGEEGVEALYADLEKHVEKYKEVPEGEILDRVVKATDARLKEANIAKLRTLHKVPLFRDEMRKLLKVKPDQIEEEEHEKPPELADLFPHLKPTLREGDTSRQQPKAVTPSQDDWLRASIKGAEARARAKERNK